MRLKAYKRAEMRAECAPVSAMRLEKYGSAPLPDVQLATEWGESEWRTFVSLLNLSVGHCA